MLFTETSIPGVWTIDPTPIVDERGAFGRVWCRELFEEKGLNTEMAQCSVSFNLLKGTLRGMHYQVPPHEEVKLVRCTQGAIYDVLLDLRPDSPTYLSWVGVELNAVNHRMVYVPEGVAHGFISLENNSEVFYQISMPYHPESARGVRWDDPAFNIQWPMAPVVMSDKDKTYPNYSL
jgi:dTDP-4-dehydrorhamnose 3,5-epimerase